MQKVKNFLNKIFQFVVVDRPYSLLILYLSLAVVVSVQNYLLPQKMLGGNLHTEYNNYLIFKQSFFHLMHNQDIYTAYPSEHWDLYKYSPTFSLFFTPFALLPDILGLIVWNGFNVAVLFWGVRMLPGLSLVQTTKIFLFVVFELLTALQNTQSNILMAGLLNRRHRLDGTQKLFWCDHLLNGNSLYQNFWRHWFRAAAFLSFQK